MDKTRDFLPRLKEIKAEQARQRTLNEFLIAVSVVAVLTAVVYLS